MDSWNVDQLKKMQMGGNGRLNSFLKQYGVEKDMDIKDKYNSKAAEVQSDALLQACNVQLGFTECICNPY